jgi:hypothetical protein
VPSNHVDFDVDTTELRAQVQQRQRQTAERYRRTIEGTRTESRPESPTGVCQ